MKHYNEITHLSYLDIVFVTGKSSNEAKKIVADILDIKELTATGRPKIKVSDKILKKSVGFTMKSNSNLEGKCRLKYLVDYYNKGCQNSKLKEFGENKDFIKNIKFTKEHSILNHILNEDQYEKLQGIWLLDNISKKNNLDKVSAFIEKNEWTIEFLKKRGLDPFLLIKTKER